MTPKRQRFHVAHIAGQATGVVQGPFVGPKLALKAVFLRYTHITPMFWGQTDPAQWNHNFPIS